ncbi:MAG: hypothetical protein Q8N63_08740 [Nanoarchaeota archaeon]|nr:hypothetical protein [Nanoarchaeota archaeon]
MLTRRKSDWFSQQKNEVIRRISWYWFVQPESPSSISIKLYPREAYTKHYNEKTGKIKNFTYYRVSTHKRTFTRKGKEIEINDGYKDITPETYFTYLNPTKNDNNYKLKQKILNLNFLFDYLSSKGVSFGKEEAIFRDFLDKPEIRKFLFEWNKYKSEEMSYHSYIVEVEVYDFKRDLVDAIITFLRSIAWIDEDNIPGVIFDKKIVPKYFKILPIVKDFFGDNFNNHNVRKYNKAMNLLEKLERL